MNRIATTFTDSALGAIFQIQDLPSKIRLGLLALVLALAVLAVVLGIFSTPSSPVFDAAVPHALSHATPYEPAQSHMSDHPGARLAGAKSLIPNLRPQRVPMLGHAACCNLPLEPTSTVDRGWWME